MNTLGLLIITGAILTGAALDSGASLWIAAPVLTAGAAWLRATRRRTP